jgi:SAM-dependent methyltransferase
MFNASLMPMLKAPARRCLRLVGKMRKTIGPATRPKDASSTPFRCNVCGTSQCLPRQRVAREDGPCVNANCRCYGRLRAMMYAVTSQFSPRQPILARMVPRKNLRGLGCSDARYAGLLAEKFDYVNTFYDQEPQLDLCNVDWLRWAPESFDFITCTDVFEHVEPPVQRVFDNMYRLLKPGGVAFLTVPTTLDPSNCEHFPVMKDWKIEEQDGRRVLVNRRADGVVERFDDLSFHGGGGMTLEFRVFSRRGLLDNVDRAGFRVAKLYDRSIEAHAIPLAPGNFVLVAEKPGGAITRPEAECGISIWRWMRPGRKRRS